MEINKTWLRFLGVAGLLGGLTLFAGDMLFYYDSTSTDLLSNMGNASDFRVTVNGVLALFATWLYLLGSVQVYYAFTPARKSIRYMMFLSFAGILISYGIVHSAYIAIAATAKLAVENQLDIQQATALAVSTNQAIRMLIYPIFAFLSFVFLWQVWKRRTLYPRWMIFFFPLIPFLLKGVITQGLSGSLWIVVYGGYLNLMLVVFFAASTAALWNHNPEHG